METSPKTNPWTPTRIVHELMAIWFGSVHALSTVCDMLVAPEVIQKPFQVALLTYFPDHYIRYS